MYAIGKCIVHNLYNIYTIINFLHKNVVVQWKVAFVQVTNKFKSISIVL